MFLYSATTSQDEGSQESGMSGVQRFTSPPESPPKEHTSEPEQEPETVKPKSVIDIAKFYRLIENFTK